MGRAIKHVARVSVAQSTRHRQPEPASQLVLYVRPFRVCVNGSAEVWWFGVVSVEHVRDSQLVCRLVMMIVHSIRMVPGYLVVLSGQVIWAARALDRVVNMLILSTAKTQVAGLAT